IGVAEEGEDRRRGGPRAPAHARLARAAEAREPAAFVVFLEHEEVARAVAVDVGDDGRRDDLAAEPAPDRARRHEPGAPPERARDGAGEDPRQVAGLRREDLIEPAPELDA